jgi:hypothetical protein
MNTKAFVWIGLTVGSFVGSMIPLLWHADMFSFSSILFSGVGGIAGIYFGYKLSK